MKNYMYFLSLLLLCLSGQGLAQSRQGAVVPLEIGDPLPDLRLDNVLNHPTGTIQLSDYRGRWLILDFWATWCGPCIGMFPKADSLEQLFEGKLAFLPVTYEPAQLVRHTFEKRMLLKGLSPPIVTSEEKLHALFPHRVLPHYVWIDPRGVVRAFTGPKEINAQQIRKVLEEEQTATSLRVKEDDFLPFEREDPLLSLNKILPAPEQQYHSALTSYLKGLSPFFSYEPPGPGRGARILQVNSSIRGLFQTAYSQVNLFFGDNRIAWKGKEEASWREELEGQDYEDWLEAGNGFCYELRLPARLAGQEWTFMQQDLARFFPRYQAGVEVMEWPVLALVKTSRLEPIKSKGGKPKLVVTPTGAFLQNVPLISLLYRLNVTYQQGSPGPLVDRTGYEEPVDLLLEGDMTELSSLRKALQAYGLDLVEKKAATKVLVIREVPAAP